MAQQGNDQQYNFFHGMQVLGDVVSWAPKLLKISNIIYLRKIRPANVAINPGRRC
jgi:hypothetical protein